MQCVTKENKDNLHDLGQSNISDEPSLVIGVEGVKKQLLSLNPNKARWFLLVDVEDGV